MPARSGTSENLENGQSAQFVVLLGLCAPDRAHRLQRGDQAQQDMGRSLVQAALAVGQARERKVKVRW